MNFEPKIISFVLSVNIKRQAFTNWSVIWRIHTKTPSTFEFSCDEANVYCSRDYLVWIHIQFGFIFFHIPHSILRQKLVLFVQIDPRCLENWHFEKNIYWLKMAQSWSHKKVTHIPQTDIITYITAIYTRLGTMTLQQIYHLFY